MLYLSRSRGGARKSNALSAELGVMEDIHREPDLVRVKLPFRPQDGGGNVVDEVSCD